MGRALIIGAGGVAGVAIHKCCQNSEVFNARLSTTSGLYLLISSTSSGTLSAFTCAVVIFVPELVELINSYKPDVVLNLALPYQDLTIMDACLETKTHYVDTANYEPEDTPKFDYSWRLITLISSTAMAETMDIRLQPTLTLRLTSVRYQLTEAIGRTDTG